MADAASEALAAGLLGLFETGISAAFHVPSRNGGSKDVDDSLPLLFL